MLVCTVDICQINTKNVSCNRCFDNGRKYRLLKQIFVKKEIYLCHLFLNSSKMLFGMLKGPTTGLAFNELIIEVTSSSSVELNVRASSTGS